MAKVIAISSAKGGVGKTSSTIELATILKNMGHKVLVIDLDENCSLSKNVGAELYADKTIYEVLHVKTNPDFEMDEIIQHLDLFDIIVGSKSLSKISKEFCINPEDEDEYIVADICEFIAKEYGYDFIFLDNAPSRSLLLTMTYIASDYVLIPTVCDECSLDMVDETLGDIKKLTSGRKALSHAKVIGLILNMYKNSNMYNAAYDMLKDIETDLNIPVYTVNYAIKVSEVKTLRTAVSKINKGSTVARAYYEIAEDIVKISKGE